MDSTFGDLNFTMSLFKYKHCLSCALQEVKHAKQYIILALKIV